jgi:hypothetical protein
MTPIVFETFRDKQSATDLQKIMKTAITGSVGKGKVQYVAAKNYNTGKATVNLFLVVDAAHVSAFENLIKQRGGTVSHGQATVAKETKDEKVTNKVVIHNATGGLDVHKMGEQIIKPAIGAKNDPLWVARSEKQEEEEQHKEYMKSDKPKPDPVKMVRASIKQAKKEGLLEPDAPQGAVDVLGRKKLNIAVDNNLLKQVAGVTKELPEYQKFAKAYEALAIKYEFTTDDDYEKVPVNIWRDLLTGLSNSGYIQGKIPYNGDPKFFILAYEGEKGQIVREKMLMDAMNGLQVYTRHASLYFDKIIDYLHRNGAGKPWAFWSGAGAKDAAREYAGEGMVLEGGVGSWFDEVYEFKPFTGTENMALWAAMSEMYAKKAAENLDKFKFVGYLGAGATREQSVFNKIEQPTFVKVANASLQVVPKITWYVVDCVKENNYWVGSGKNPTAFPNRQAALDNIKERYGG